MLGGGNKDRKDSHRNLDPELVPRSRAGEAQLGWSYQWRMSQYLLGGCKRTQKTVKMLKKKNLFLPVLKAGIHSGGPTREVSKNGHKVPGAQGIPW